MPLAGSKFFRLILTCGIVVLSLFTLDSIGDHIYNSLDDSAVIIYFEEDQPSQTKDIYFAQPYVGMCSRDREKFLSAISDEKAKSSLSEIEGNITYCTARVEAREIHTEEFSRFAVEAPLNLDMEIKKDGVYGYMLVHKNPIPANVIGSILAFSLLAMLWTLSPRLDWRSDLIRFKATVTTKPYILVVPAAGQALVGLALNVFPRLAQHAYSAIDAVLIAPVVEEMIYRLFLFNIVKAQSNKVFSLIFVSTLFSYGHGYDVNGFVSLLVGGVILQLIYIKYRSITLCICAHSMVNIFVIVGRFSV